MRHRLGTVPQGGSEQQIPPQVAFIRVEDLSASSNVPTNRNGVGKNNVFAPTNLFITVLVQSLYNYFENISLKNFFVCAHESFSAFLS